MTKSTSEVEDGRRTVVFWLFGCAALLWLLVGIGGATRLTGSGLSIPSWRPVTGVLPPLGAAAWEREFAAYRATPEFRLDRPAMTLAEYRRIYAWEYLHRLVARLLGAAFALPLAWFAWRRRLPRGFGAPLAAILALGALQGAVGWWMVRSGLVDEPRVSHLRLATHLGLALAIFGALLWAARSLRESSLEDESSRRGSGFGLAAGLVAIVFVQALLGALMAGTRAGHLFPTFPRMAGTWIPGGLFALSPGPRSLLDDPVTIHFLHRWAGIVIVFLAFAGAVATWRRPAGDAARRATRRIALAASVTAGLGVVTLLTRVAIVPAVAHQLAALLLLGSVIVALSPRGGSPRERVRVPAERAR